MEGEEKGEKETEIKGRRGVSEMRTVKRDYKEMKINETSERDTKGASERKEKQQTE